MGESSGKERLSRRALFSRFRVRAADAAIDKLDSVIPEPPPPQLILHKERCFTFRGPECGACIGYCPEEAEGALFLQLCKPVIDPELCIGCGDCVSACPTIPKSLEIVEPRAQPAQPAM